MIHINLLGERKKQLITFKAPTGPPKSSFLLLLLLLVTVVVGAYLYQRYQALNRDLVSVQTQVAAAEREKQHRQQLLREIEAFEKRKRVLEGRIAVIDELKKSQMGPIQWLNALGVAIDQTQSVWLTSVGQTGDRMTIEGVATSLNGVADFATTLKRSGIFKNVSVDESEQTNISGLEGYSFTISCDSKPGAASTKS